MLKVGKENGYGATGRRYTSIFTAAYTGICAGNMIVPNSVPSTVRMTTSLSQASFPKYSLNVAEYLAVVQTIVISISGRHKYGK